MTIKTMNKTVYYLEHKDSGRRLKWYNTRTGARIAQKLRNRKLGFGDELERKIINDKEVCWYSTPRDGHAKGTWIVVEDVIDSVDLLE